MSEKRFMPPREVAEWLYDLDDAIKSIESECPDRMVSTVVVEWYGEPYARLYEEGWGLL